MSLEVFSMDEAFFLLLSPGVGVKLAHVVDELVVFDVSGNVDAEGSIICATLGVILGFSAC